MRRLLTKAAVISAAALLAACATTYSNSKKMSREDVALDVLDCQKAAVLRYKAAHVKRDAPYAQRLAASKAGRAAWDRCLKSRGWKKNT